MVAKELGLWALLIGRGWGRRQLIIASDPDVSHGLILFGFKGMWPVRLFHLDGCAAETQLRSRCYL